MKVQRPYWGVSRARRSLLMGAAFSLAAGWLVAPAMSSAAGKANTGMINYQVSPIAIPSTLTTGSFPTPAECVARFGFACYTPDVFHTAYDVPWTINGQLAGSGTQVAIVDAFGSPTVASDLAVYDQTFGLPAADLHVYYPDGKVPYNDFVKGSIQSNWAFETSLDVQSVHDFAPGARINLIVASSPNGNDINVAEQYAVTHHLGDVLSMSYGAPEAAIAGGGNNLQLRQSDAILGQAVSQGMSIFASSGDSGAGNGYATPNALFPASDPHVTATGGTDLFVNGNNTYQGETTWNDSVPSLCPFGCIQGPFGATGGAYSSVFQAPSYQPPQSSSSMRSTSDVSFNASVYTATMIYVGFALPGEPPPGFYFVGGTSEAAPSWAGIAADVVQAKGQDLGALNPVLYRIASNASTYASDFHDVTVGQNGWYGPGYNAGTNYDLPTGLGTPIVSGLIGSLAPGAALGYTKP